MASILAAASGAAAEAPGSATGHEKWIKPFFAEHCTKCHDAKKQKDDLRVDTLKVKLDSPKIMAHWEEIMNRINSGDMPPDDEPRPKADEVAKVADWIAEQLHEAACEAGRTPNFKLQTSNAERQMK